MEMKQIFRNTLKFAQFLALLGISIASISQTAYATPLTWSFEESTFTDGGAVSGFFVFDPVTNALSNIAFHTSGGTSFAGANYLNVDPATSPSPGALFFSPATFTIGSSVFFLEPDNPLTNAGGAQHFADAEYLCQNADCSIVDELRTGDGYISTLPGSVAATPEPSSLILLCTGLATTAFTSFRLRKRTKES
jgi:hypothetical protein